MKTNIFLRKRMGSILVFCFLIVNLTIFTNSVLCSVGIKLAGGTINGMVFDSGRKGLVDVDVELQDEYSRFIARTRTTSGGRFTFSGLQAGPYKVRVMGGRFGFSEQVQNVEIVSFSRGSAGLSSDTVYVDFYLQVLKPSSLAESVGIPVSIFVQEIPAEASKLYKQGISDLDQKKTDVGIESLRKAISIFPTYFLALHRLGEEYVRTQKYDAAEEVLKKAVEVNTRAADSFYLLGYSQYVTKNYKAAVASLNQSVTLSSKSAAAFLLLGMSSRQIAKYSDAETQMVKAKVLANKKIPDIYWQLALLYANNLKRYNDAADELEIFLKIQPDSKDVESIKKLIKQFRTKGNQTS